MTGDAANGHPAVVFLLAEQGCSFGNDSVTGQEPFKVSNLLL